MTLKIESGPAWRTTIMLVVAMAGSQTALPEDDWIETYREPAQRILEAAQANDAAWQRLAELTDTFGNRLSGSPQLEAAIRWVAAQMESDGLENVRLEQVEVPHWVRGEESVSIVEPVPSELAMLGLGNSIGTRPEGATGEIMIVTSFEELDERAVEAAGRIVLYDVPFTSYRETVRYRSSGASRAARHGALAALVRSVGPPGLRTPHTGALRYEEGVTTIPAAALAAEDVGRLRRMIERGQRVVVRLRMEAHFLPDAQSANVIGEWVGRERPEEIVLLGGHIDSWDVGTGAMDDGGGCIVTWEALRLLKELGLRPRRTLRVVLFTNEENGLRGGTAYRDQHLEELGRHVLALESDSGVFKPRGFGFTGGDEARGIVTEIARLLGPIDASWVGPRGGGADIGPSVREAEIPSMSLEVDGPYFSYHHTLADTVERLEPADVALNVAAVAVMAYVVADRPEPLPR